MGSREILVSSFGQRRRVVAWQFPARLDSQQTAVYFVPVKVREVVRMLEEDGWNLVRTRGSHHQYKHPTKKGLATIPGNRNDEIAPGTLSSILKQAGLKR
jgi:predicted RNA binding protein YcfA (HicA-like mRNA interferase family)